MRTVRAIAVLCAASIFFTSNVGATAAVVQPSYDALRIESNGAIVRYQAWDKWRPTIVTTPDNGAWAFFTAEAPSGGKDVTKRLYAARFDPKVGVWEPAKAMPGREIQFGPSAVVDATGVVHVVFSDHVKDSNDTNVVYTKSDGQGGWTKPVSISPDPKAGAQVAPSVAIDGAGKLYVMWQDQRGVVAASRTDLSNADIYASDLGTGGVWSPAVLVSQRPGADTYANQPDVVVDGDRLVAIWLIYDKATIKQSATRIEWSTRPLGDPQAWAKPQPLVERGDGGIGRNIVDLAANPAGGSVLIYGRVIQTATPNSATPTMLAGTELFVRRLDRGATSWAADTSVGSRLYRPYLSAAVSPDGSVQAVYAVAPGPNLPLQIAGTVLPPNATKSGPETMLTVGEDGAQILPAVAVDAAGKPWVFYAHVSIVATGTGRAAVLNEMRCLRGARLAG